MAKIKERSNLLISYLTPENNNEIDNIKLEMKLKNEIAQILANNGIKKFIVADDEMINKNILKGD